MDAFLGRTYYLNGGHDNKHGMSKLNARMEQIEVKLKNTCTCANVLRNTFVLNNTYTCTNVLRNTFVLNISIFQYTYKMILY